MEIKWGNDRLEIKYSADDSPITIRTDDAVIVDIDPKIPDRVVFATASVSPNATFDVEAACPTK